MLKQIGGRTTQIAMALCAIAAVSACAPASHFDDELSAPYALMVNNRSDFEVVVYAMASPLSRGIRLGTARPFSTTYLRVPAGALQSNDLLAVQAHAIGAVRSVGNWTSTATVMNGDLMAQLDIIADHTGNLQMSNLSTRLSRVH